MDKISSPFKIKEGDIIEAFKKIQGGEFEYADVSNGEVSVFHKVAKSKRVIIDRANYVKIYKNGYEVLKGLSANGVKLFIYISLHLGIHTDTIFIDNEVVSEWCGWKKTVHYSAITELIKKEVIARKGGSNIEYFVNPNFIFNGSRLKL